MANGEGLRDRAGKAAAQRKTDKPSNEVATTESKDPARQLLTPMASELEAALPQQIGVETFTRVLLTLLHDQRLGPKLMACKRPTLYKAMLDAAHYGLMPGTDEAAIIPYGSEAVFVPMYQGLVKLMHNTGDVGAVEAHLIYREDDWNLEYGDRGGFYHRLRLFDGEGNLVPHGTPENPAVLAYCYLTYKDGGRSGVEFMTRQQAIEIRDTYSRAYQMAEKYKKYDSRWHLDFDKMWLKSVVRQAAKWVPKSAVILELLMHDAQADSKDRPALPASPPPFNPGGPAAAWEGDVTHGNGTVVQGQVENGEQEPPADPPTDPPAPPKQERPQRQGRQPAEPPSAGDAWDQAEPLGGAS